MAGPNIQNVEHLHSNAKLLVDFDPDLAINRHGVIPLDTVIFDQGTFAKIAELHAAEKRAHIPARERRPERVA